MSSETDNIIQKINEFMRNLTTDSLEDRQVRLPERDQE